VTFVIAEPCVGTKDHSCVDVCPVDCIHPTPGEPGFEEAEQLYIDPEECIDCGACEGECPVQAIYAADALPEAWALYERVNAEHYARGTRT
jgi:NAD-dependent dihydropyrimidine dehydrogenase PreA subunit